MRPSDRPGAGGPAYPAHRPPSGLRRRVTGAIHGTQMSLRRRSRFGLSVASSCSLTGQSPARSALPIIRVDFLKHSTSSPECLGPTRSLGLTRVGYRASSLPYPHQVLHCINVYSSHVTLRQRMEQLNIHIRFNWVFFKFRLNELTSKNAYSKFPLKFLDVKSKR